VACHRDTLVSGSEMWRKWIKVAKEEGLGLSGEVCRESGEASEEAKGN